MITPEQLAKSGSESGNQQALLCWAQQNIKQYPELKWFFAIPNGGFRDIKTAGKLKAEGVKRGVPDLCLLVKRANFAALWIELKRPKSNKKRAGVVQDEQNEWIDYLRSQGHGAIVCYGWEGAKAAIIQYLEWK